LAQEADPNRPVPNQTFEGALETINIGSQTIELHHLGNFHSNGDLLIFLPEQKVAMLVDLLRPGASPYKAFGVTPDIDLYLEIHDVLQDYDFDVLVSGHT
jgi:glyoxylase-like metal-dependent hydrolase (beta-lactamase superfamily II)